MESIDRISKIKEYMEDKKTAWIIREVEYNGEWNLASLEVRVITMSKVPDSVHVHVLSAADTEFDFCNMIEVDMTEIYFTEEDCEQEIRDMYIEGWYKS